MKWIKQNDEVFYPKQQNFLKIAKEDIDSLIEIAKNNLRERARYCTHNSINDVVHEMIIYHRKGTYVRPHKHINKTESFFIIDGEADIIIFDEKGNPKSLFYLGVYGTGKTFYYRIPQDVYHTQIFRKDTIFHEVTMGPFKNEDTVYADWAPKEDEKELVFEFTRDLNNNFK